MTRNFGVLGLRRAHANDAIDTDRLLGAVTYGSNGACSDPAAFGNVPMPALAGDDAVHTAWYAEGPFTTASHGTLQYRYNDQFLFGFIALNEADFSATGERSAIQQLSHAAYSTVFEALAKAGFHHLVHCWNYLHRITDADGGVERYQQFNIGRQDAFMAAQRSHLAGSPSACALGLKDGSLVVYFLATHEQPQPIENPRQVSAYRYPDQYGPRSPTFSRAVVLPIQARDALFVSGTASIVGHASVHHGDVAAQTAETLRNIDVIVKQANLKSRWGGFATRDLSLKVFVRHPKDVNTVAAVLRESLGDSVDAKWFEADMCREELLVEIEAFGYRDAPSV